VDRSGNAYVTGFTLSTNFPTANPLQPTHGGGSYDAFVVKLNAAGSALTYSTYLGGNEIDQGLGIAVDGAGNAYVAGFTGSTNFPTANPLLPTLGGGGFFGNHRLLSFDGNNITFRWGDYAHGNKQKTMMVSANEFIRRFLLHVLPKGFVRIRHFGFMANSQRSASMELCHQLLAMAPAAPSEEVVPKNSTWLCSICRAPMTVIQRLTPAQIAWRFPSQSFSDTS